MATPDGTILVIDQGTQSLRGTLVDSRGGKDLICSQSLKTDRARMLCEQDPEEWRRGVWSILERVRSRPDDLRSLRAVVCSGVLASAVAIGPDGSPLRPALMYSDQRPAEVLGDIEGSAAFRQLRSETGWRAYAGDFLPQVLYLARRERGVYRRASRILDATGYLNFLLTGRATMDAFTRHSCYGSPSSCGLPKALLSELGLEAGKLGEPVEVGEVSGALAPVGFAADALPNVPVVAATYDSMSAYLGAGLNAPGDALDISGTVTSFGVISERGVIDEDRRIYSIPLPNQGAWLVRGSTAFSGGTLEWARKQLVRDSFEGFDELVDQSPPGAHDVIMLPYLAGERAPVWNPFVRGAFYGIGADTTVADIARAVYEGICYSLRHIQMVQEQQGVCINTVKLAGGLARNERLSRIKADITGKTLVPLRDFELTTLGAAAIAGHSLGWFSSLREAHERLVRTENPVQPDKSNRRAYDRTFERYVKLSRILCSSFGNGDGTLPSNGTQPPARE
jgi:xylulokinase